MLSEFVIEHRAEIIARCRAKAAARTELPATDALHGIPLFLDQLVEILRAGAHGASAITPTGTIHGAELLLRGLTVGQVVHDYGDVCQTITALAIERTVRIPSEDFQLLNLCLDDAIASAVTEYVRQRELEVAADTRDRSSEDIGILSYEVGSLLWSAALAFDALKTGRVGLSGTTAAVVTCSLANLRSLIERSFAVMRLKGRGSTRERISVGQLLDVVQRSMTGEAIAVDARFRVEIQDASAVFEADHQILAPIVAQLVRNAHSHTPASGHVVLRSSATINCVRLEIEDECGGLPNGVASAMFEPPDTAGAKHSGLRLGLGLSRRGLEAVGGTIAVRDLPGKGCVFTIELPLASSAK